MGTGGWGWWKNQPVLHWALRRLDIFLSFLAFHSAPGMFFLFCFKRVLLPVVFPLMLANHCHFCPFCLSRVTQVMQKAGLKSLPISWWLKTCWISFVTKFLMVNLLTQPILAVQPYTQGLQSPLHSVFQMPDSQLVAWSLGSNAQRTLQAMRAAQPIRHAQDWQNPLYCGSQV